MTTRAKAPERIYVVVDRKGWPSRAYVKGETMPIAADERIVRYERLKRTPRTKTAKP